MAHEELPLPNYDQLPLATLRHRIRSLDQSRLRDLIKYERRHGARVHVLEVLEARLRQLHEGAEVSPGSQEETPEVTHAPAGSPVRHSTAAEPGTPLRHGVAQQTPARGRP
jgi:hypothetical protein